MGTPKYIRETSIAVRSAGRKHVTGEEER